MTEDRRKEIRKYLNYSGVNNNENRGDLQYCQISGNWYGAKTKKKGPFTNSIILPNHSSQFSPINPK